MAICNDPIQSDLMQVRRLQLQHLMDPLPVDLIRRLDQLLRASIRSAKTLLNQLLAVLVQQVKGVEMRTSRDLDQLREAVADLSSRQGPQEREVEEGVDRGVVGAQTVLVIAVVDGDLDGDGCVDQSDDRGRDPDEVCVAAVSGTCESVRMVSAPRVTYSRRQIGGDLPSDISDETASNDKNWFLFSASDTVAPSGDHTLTFL
jgi:hypothetical protein